MISVIYLILQIREALLSGWHGSFLWSIISYRAKISTSINNTERVTQQGGRSAQMPLPYISFPHASSPYTSRFRVHNIRSPTILRYYIELSSHLQAGFYSVPRSTSFSGYTKRFSCLNIGRYVKLSG